MTAENIIKSIAFSGITLECTDYRVFSPEDSKVIAERVIKTIMDDCPVQEHKSSYQSILDQIRTAEFTGMSELSGK